MLWHEGHQLHRRVQQVQVHPQQGPTDGQGGLQQCVAVVCDNVLPSWQAFCSKVQEDLQDRVCLHTATLRLCIMIALLYVTRALCIAAHELQQFSVEYSLQSCSDLVGVAMVVNRVSHFQ